MTALTPADLVAVDRELSKRSMADFLRLSWPSIDPEPYLHNWHMDAMGEHLQAVSTGEITRLLVNVPPGTSKSSACSVFFPAWLWGPGGLPHWRFLGASHEQTLATRDNLRTRRLIQSEWFQRRWPIKLTTDQNEKTYFENDQFGFRQSSAVASMTGKRGHVVVWDDPINPEDANSEIWRGNAIRVFTETLPSRLVDPRKSAIIIIMQRLHENDVAGYILANDLGYEHLMLPMEFEPERKCYTSIGFEDPRSEEGELLFQERFPREVVDRDKKAMGSYATAGQFQQRPVPRGGGMFKRHWFEIIDAVPANTQWARGWDLAGTAKREAAWTRGALVGRNPQGTITVADMASIQGSPKDVLDLLRHTAQMDRTTYGHVRGSLPQDPGQAGKMQVQHFVTQLAGHPYTYSPESGDKITRAEPFAAQAEAGNVKLLRGDWNKAFLDEFESFPNGKWSDQVDAVSRAFMELMRTSTTSLVGKYG